MKHPVLHALASSFCALALSALAQAQTTWYVDVHGTAPGTGSLGDPYTSIQYALDRPATVTGDTLLVAPGTYVENVRIHKRVRVEASGGPEATTLRSAAPGVLVTAAALDGNPISTLRGFTLDGSADPGGVGVQTGLDFSLRIERCVVQGFTSGWGVRHHTDYLDAFQSTIAGNAVGIETDNAIDPGQVSLLGCIVRGNGVDLIDPSGFALTIHHSNVPGGYPNGPGHNNVFAPESFWDLPELDLHLAPGSPCIDSAGGFFPLDPDGSPADMGALTYDPAHAPGPSVFCTAKVNSQGCVPQIGFVGEPTSTGSLPFVVSASETLPGRVGLLFYGPGKRSQPFQGGTHCVKLPTRRVGVQAAGGAGTCGGTYGFDFAAHLASGVDPQLVPGALIACQWWSRDPLDVSGFGTGLTDGLYFGVAP